MLILGLKRKVNQYPCDDDKDVAPYMNLVSKHHKSPDLRDVIL